MTKSFYAIRNSDGDLSKLVRTDEIIPGDINFILCRVSDRTEALRIIRRRRQNSKSPKYVIWWLDQLQTEAAMEKEELLPPRLRRMLDKRYGRPGCGRLWFKPGLKHFAVEPWPDTSLSRELSRDSGGLVIDAKDKKYLTGMPGIITDGRCNLLG